MAEIRISKSKMLRSRRRRPTRTRSHRDERRSERTARSRTARWIETFHRLAAAKLVRIGPCDVASVVLLYIGERNFLRYPAMKATLAAFAIAAATFAAAATDQPAKAKIDPAQIPKWSADDLDFFFHGSMSTEVVPERVLRAFIKIYPDLFPASDLAYLGLISDPAFGWPIGFSRKTEVKHLGGLSAVGINCASCHVAQIHSSGAKELMRILRATSHFNVQAFFGSVLISTFKNSEPARMKLFLAAYFSNPTLDAAWEAQQAKITEAMAADPFGAKGLAPGELHEI